MSEPPRCPLILYMSAARLTRDQHFQSDIFRPVAGGKLRKARRTQTYQSTVFASSIPEKRENVRRDLQVNYARSRYQESSSVLDGAREQAANVTMEDRERTNFRLMKTAGKKANPCGDFVYRPRLSQTSQSSVFLQEPEAPVITAVRPKRVTEASTTVPRQISLLEKTASSHYPSDLTEPLTLLLSDIPSQLSPADIQRFCCNTQVVSAKVAADPLTGRCQGSGLLQVRGNPAELKRMELTLLSSGITVKHRLSN